MKEVTIALVCILMAIGNMAFASGKDTLATSKKVKTETTASVKGGKKVLSAEEIKFYNEIETFYQDTYVNTAQQEILPAFNFKRIVVYGADGAVVQEQKGKLDLNKLPKGANKLFVEGEVAYYYMF